MKTFILEWNPLISSYKMKTFEEDILCIESVKLNWSVFEHEKAQSGDNFYMVKCENGYTSIIMKGFFVSDPYEDDDRSRKKHQVFYMDLHPTFMIHPDVAPMINTAEMERVMPDFQWNGGPSGRELPEEYAKILDDVWERYIDGLPDDMDMELFGENDEQEANIEDAISCASSVLYGYTDRDGRPMILSALRTGFAMDTEEEMICGILYFLMSNANWTDGWTAGDVREHGFSERVANLLILLQPKEDEEYEEYRNRIESSGDETAVKILGILTGEISK